MRTTHTDGEESRNGTRAAAPAGAEQHRADVTGARRVVVKVGSSSLTTPDGHIERERIGELADVLAERRAAGVEVVLVSSGAVAAGMTPLGLARRPRDLATQQAAASVGQGLLLAHYSAALARHGVTAAQVLLTVDDMMRRTQYRNAQRTLGRLLEIGALPIVNENDTVATDEIRFGDNDRLAALVAHLLRAEALVLLSDVDALYDGNPSRPGARRIPEVRGPADLEGVDIGTAGRRGVGTGGMVTKVESARIATEAGVPTVLTSAANVRAALVGEPVGTYFAPSRRRRPSTRQLWLAHATAGRGSVVLDPGAVRAVVREHASLLPAGVVKVEGEFAAGDPVDLRDEDGVIVARGLVNYDSAEIPDLMGRSTRWLARELGPAYEREVVHRDDLVLLARHRR
ncbi:glutamate 5-kinase [Marinitenerispora sediminis]|uniref:Glutamate 5-kinase n=1 Tax=Marinitenerispora sediminis TaxID=1931232 RepID=A0A368T3N6_9ACTN|nr:glutamate 5-kinase [Marinitenerispora sediminis]RCV52941.1 glutamate 5-kinase [Marinitenerispora sediminis]RCV53889.1 glutamate 5-kinase [Marinitenerispora sediminis]RCV57052.1 glutamate 5-kinase [Marinitenerispora sediminis]